VARTYTLTHTDAHALTTYARALAHTHAHDHYHGSPNVQTRLYIILLLLCVPPLNRAGRGTRIRPVSSTSLGLCTPFASRRPDDRGLLGVLTDPPYARETRCRCGVRLRRRRRRRGGPCARLCCCPPGVVGPEERVRGKIGRTRDAHRRRTVKNPDGTATRKTTTTTTTTGRRVCGDATYFSGISFERVRDRKLL